MNHRLFTWGDTGKSRLGRARAAFDISRVESLNTINAELSVSRDTRATTIEKFIAKRVALGHELLTLPVAIISGAGAFFSREERK